MVLLNLRYFNIIKNFFIFFLLNKWKVFFEAITFELKKNDIIDCVCTSCDVMCVNAKLGPVDIVISRKEIPTNYEFS